MVAEGRNWARQKNGGAGAALNPDWASYADGRVLSGTEAFKLGFVDQLGSFDDAVERARRIAGISSATVVQYQQRYDLWICFICSARPTREFLRVDLGLDAPKLRAGMLYFLSPRSCIKEPLRNHIYNLTWSFAGWRRCSLVAAPGYVPRSRLASRQNPGVIL